MLDLNKLTHKELRELEKLIKEEQKTRNELEGWKITFFIRFNPNKTTRLVGEYGEDDLGDFMVNDVTRLIIDGYGLTGAEDVSGCDIVVAEPEEIAW